MTFPPLDQATLFRAAADIVVALHAAFVAFVVLGGLLVVRWRRIAWVHVPAFIWGVLIEFAGWICPLTPIENYLRQRSGSSTYQGDFIEHYVLPLLYAARLTREGQIWLGAFAIIINVLVYWQAIGRASRPRLIDIPVSKRHLVRRIEDRSRQVTALKAVACERPVCGPPYPSTASSRGLRRSGRAVQTFCTGRRSHEQMFVRHD